MPRLELTGPTYQELGHRDTIDWHDHDMQQLVYPSSGVLAISTARGTWIVPPQRAVWIPARVAHAHQAHGPTQMRTLAFPRRWIRWGWTTRLCSRSAGCCARSSRS